MSDITRLGGEGILNPDDLPDMKAGVLAVFKYMLDGEWHTKNEVIVSTRTKDHHYGQDEALRRMRELRDPRRWNLQIVKRRRTAQRRWEYRLVLDGRAGTLRVKMGLPLPPGVPWKPLGEAIDDRTNTAALLTVVPPSAYNPPKEPVAGQLWFG